MGPVDDTTRDATDDELDRRARRATRVVAGTSMGALLTLTAALAHGTAPSTANADTGTPSTTATPSTTVAPSITIAATTIPATSTTACAATYTVQPGDSWYLLAQEASITADALLAVNGATAATALYPGQSVCLPDGAVVVTTTAPPVTAATPASTTASTTDTVRTTVPATSHTTATSG